LHPWLRVGGGLEKLGFDFGGVEDELALGGGILRVLGGIGVEIFFGVWDVSRLVVLLCVLRDVEIAGATVGIDTVAGLCWDRVIRS
jgi:hypothetical protein